MGSEQDFRFISKEDWILMQKEKNLIEETFYFDLLHIGFRNVYKTKSHCSINHLWEKNLFFFPLFFFHIFLSPYDPIVCIEQLTSLYQISYSSPGPSDPSPIKVKGDVVRYSMKTEFWVLVANASHILADCGFNVDRKNHASWAFASQLHRFLIFGSPESSKCCFKLAFQNLNVVLGAIPPNLIHG